MFAEKGFTKVTMKDICEACDLSRGGLYRHYGSTQEIFEAILDGITGEVNDFVRDGIREGISAVELLDNLIYRKRSEMMYKEYSQS